MSIKEVVADLDSRMEKEPPNVRVLVDWLLLVLGVVAVLIVGGTSLWWLGGSFELNPVTWLVGLVGWTVMSVLGGVLATMMARDA